MRCKDKLNKLKLHAKNELKNFKLKNLIIYFYAMQTNFTVKGFVIDIIDRKIFPGIVTVDKDTISNIEATEEQVPEQYILPGFIDAHIHIESSMLAPSEFAKIAVLHGTVATISDPHEIANVCGLDGVQYMLDNAKEVPFKFNFGAPSCVPATHFESAGATLNAEVIDHLLSQKEILYLSEMMNFPGVLMNDEEVMKKIAAAIKHNKPIDGHAPGLKGALAKQYADAGISTDHECTEIDEAIDKINAGMYILIREGSAAKNFDALIDLIKLHPDKVMFCSDDKHPDELIKGHINLMVKKAIQLGYDLYDVLYAACILPVLHYKLNVGILRKNDPADFIVVDNLKDFKLIANYINGLKVADQKTCTFNASTPKIINNFNVNKIAANQLSILNLPATNTINVKVIDALDGQLITKYTTAQLSISNNDINSDIDNDILKIAVVNRYKNTTPAIGFIRNFGLKKGAIASSVAHDSHNIVAVGTNNESIAQVINSIIENKGGIAVYDGKINYVMPLPIAGLMTEKNALTAANDYELLDQKAKALGSKLAAPFMTLSFMALPVIPSLKITDKGLFDVDKFNFTQVVI